MLIERTQHSALSIQHSAMLSPRRALECSWRSPVALRRGAGLVLGLILGAVVLSFGVLALLVATAGRGPSVGSNSTLFLHVGGDLAETEPGGLVGQFIEAPPTLRGMVDALRKAKVDRRVSGVVFRPSSLGGLWGKVQELREAIVDFRRSGKPIVGFLEYGGQQEYLPRLGLRQGLSHAGELARPERRGLVRSLPARRPRQDWRLSRLPPHRRVQDRGEHDDGADVHARPPRDVGVADLRHVRAAREGHRRGAEEERGRRARDHRAGPGPARGSGAARPRGRSRVRGSARRQDGARRRPHAPPHEQGLQPRRAVVAGAQSRPADRRHLRGRHHRERRGKLRLAGGADRGLRHARRVHPQSAGRLRHQGDRASRGQPGRIGHRVRRDLARGDADARPEADRRARCPTSPRRAATTSPCRPTSSSPSRGR